MKKHDTRAGVEAATATPIGIEQLLRRPTCSVDAAADALGVGRSTAYAAARDGSLPTVRVSGRILVPTAKLRAMLGIEDTRE